MSKITESARGKTCIRCGGHDAYACHYNGQHQHTFGKGMGIKCHDLASAEFCHTCDQIFSEGRYENFLNDCEREEQWFKWIMLTNIRRYTGGVLCAKEG